jgi:hypothetical protein
MNNARAAALALSFVAISSIASPTPAEAQIHYNTFYGWITQYHRNVLLGDAHVNAVLIVVDTNSQYVASLADSLSIETVAAIDSAFASVGSRNGVAEMARELVAGRLRVPGATGQAVYIVDGVRTGRVDSLNATWIENIQFATGADAAKYGADATDGGAIIVTMTHAERHGQVIGASHRQRLIKMGIQPERVDLGDVQMMHHGPGIVGPAALYVTILRLKRG